MPEKIILKGVLQTFDNTYPGRVYDEKVYHKSFRKYLRRIKIMSIFNDGETKIRPITK
jgi:hypothetical protein